MFFRKNMYEAGVIEPSSSMGNIVKRYVFDVSVFLGELRRVLIPRGEAVIVVGNSVSKSVLVTIREESSGKPSMSCRPPTAPKAPCSYW